MSDADDILAFWFAEGSESFRKAWFVKDPAFDAEIARLFGALVVPAREGAFDSWAATPQGALALLILLDQYPLRTLPASQCRAGPGEHAGRGSLARGRGWLLIGPFRAARPRACSV